MAYNKNLYTSSTSALDAGIIYDQTETKMQSEINADLKNTLNSEIATRQTYVRPNLLDNWYFGNPVNQRGLDNYVGDGYCFDRWVKSTGTHISKQSQGGYVEIKIVSTSDTNIYQKIDNPYQLSNKTITVSAMANGPCYLIIVANGREVIRAVSPNTGGADVFSVSTQLSVINSLEIYIQPHGTTNTLLNLYAVKLELGSGQTLAHQENGVWVLNEIPNYAEELAKCQRYFLPISRFSYSGAVDGTTGAHFLIPTPVEMASAGSLYGYSGFSAWASGGVITNFTFNHTEKEGGNGITVFLNSSEANLSIASFEVIPNGMPYLSADL